MGKLKAFQIVFDNDREVYNSGDVVSGQVLVDLTEPKQLRGEYLVCTISALCMLCVGRRTIL